MGDRSAARLPALDGLRGLAIIAVVAAHYFGEVPHGLRFLTAGWLGVELFFVLSGFLIGGILLDNGASANLFSVFYVRRALRIFPIYYLVLALVVGTAAAPNALPAATYLTYTQNIFMALSGRVDGFWLLPTWTLAVEEQFYLLLPVLIVFLPRKYLLATVAAAVVSGPLARAALLFAHAPLVALTLLPCRWDALFLGVFAAYAVRSPRLSQQLHTGTLQSIALAGALGVCLCAIAERATGVPVFETLGYAFIALCFAALVVRRSGFQNGALRYTGRISYCAYLIHQPLSGALHRALLHANPDIGTAASLGVTLLAAAVTFIGAALSWHFLERHLIAFGHQLTYRPRLQGSAISVAPAAHVSHTRAAG